MIREAVVTDAPAFLDLQKKIDGETKFMLYEPNERTMTVEQTEGMITSLRDAANSTVFVAEENGRLVGYLLAIGGKAARNRHNAYIVVGLLEAYTGRSLGTQMFAMLEEWAKQSHVRRLELTVMTHNERGVAFYTKMGFVIEGRKQSSLLVDEKYVDEYFMAKLLEDAAILCK